MRTPSVRMEETGSEVRVLAFDGELDISRYPEFRQQFERERVDGNGPVLIDLSKASYVDSTFLSEILFFVRGLKRAGRRAAVLSSPAAVARIFALADLDERVAVFANREDALQTLAP